MTATGSSFRLLDSPRRIGRTTMPPCRSSPRSRPSAGGSLPGSRDASWWLRASPMSASPRPEAPGDVAARLVGAEIERVGRRGKYLLLELDRGVLAVPPAHDGEPAGHPGREPRRRRFTRAELRLDDGTVVHYTDIRRFGTWRLLDHDAAPGWLDARNGPEPLGEGFTTDRPSARPARAPGAGQGSDSRPARGGRARQHLRRRGPVARPRPSGTRRPGPSGARA